MRMTSLLRQKAGGRSIKSLALSVHFRQPELGMKDFEILSRATAHLIRVDPEDGDSKATTDSSPYAHLEAAERQREERLFRNKRKYSHAGGPGRKIQELSWLEFVPREVRPQVHIIASSHVLAPFLWPDYYPHDWLQKVRAEHCAYSIEVLDPAKPSQQEALAKFALNKQVFHHPEGRDIALIHLQEEASTLKILKGLGVELHTLRSPDKMYQKGEDMFFDGFVVSEPNAADNTEAVHNNSKKSNNDEDTRVFFSHKEKGQLSFHTQDRFFASTSEPLPEGLCGAPVLDTDDDLCGMVEGIVPTTHEDKRLAGNAVFIPSYRVHQLIDFVERGLVQEMMPKELFDLVVTAKKTNSIGGAAAGQGQDGSIQGVKDIEQAYDSAIEMLKKRYSKEQFDAMMGTLEKERTEALKIFDQEGGDLDEIVARVREKTLAMQKMILEQYERTGVMPDSSSFDASNSVESASGTGKGQ